jgi:hypothetical protein
MWFCGTSRDTDSFGNPEISSSPDGRRNPCEIGVRSFTRLDEARRQTARTTLAPTRS